MVSGRGSGRGSNSDVEGRGSFGGERESYDRVALIRGPGNISIARGIIIYLRNAERFHHPEWAQLADTDSYPW